MEIIKKEVEFNGVNLTGIKTQDGKIYIVVKTFCEILGLDSSGQLQRIKRDETLSEGVGMMPIPTESGKQETTLLELDFLPMWLTGIKADRCREEIRPYLKEFKLKAKDILADAFLGKRSNQVLEGEYSPEDIEILQRVERIIKNKTSIVDFLVDIALDYDWIIERAGTGFEKIKLKYQEMQQRTFMIGGKALSLEDIDSLNADQKKEILKKLEKRKN